VLILECCW